jgi:hypothetical protein
METTSDRAFWDRIHAQTTRRIAAERVAKSAGRKFRRAHRQRDEARATALLHLAWRLWAAADATT